MRQLLVVFGRCNITEGEGKFLHINGLKCPYFSPV